MSFMKSYSIDGCKRDVINKMVAKGILKVIGTHGEAGLYKYNGNPVAVAGYHVVTCDKNFVLELVKRHLGQRSSKLEIMFKR